MTNMTHPRMSHDPFPTPKPARSNFALLLISATFLCVAIGLVFVRPLLPNTDTPQFAAPAPVPTPTTEATEAAEPVLTILDAEPESPTDTSVEEDVVTQAARAPLIPALQNTAPVIDLAKVNANDVAAPQFALFSNTFTPLDRVTSATIKQQLRQPIRLIDNGSVKRDIPGLTSEIVQRLTLKGEVDSKLTNLVAEAVAERQSDQYVRTLVNTVADRETLEVPETLRTTQGDWDTYSLLKAMAKTAGGPIERPEGNVETNGTQKIVPGDSLARIALRYYGDPLKYSIILAANPQIDPINPVLSPGDVILMPKP